MLIEGIPSWLDNYDVISIYWIKSACYLESLIVPSPLPEVLPVFPIIGVVIYMIHLQLVIEYDFFHSTPDHCITGLMESPLVWESWYPHYFNHRNSLALKFWQNSKFILNIAAVSCPWIALNTCCPILQCFWKVISTFTVCLTKI